MLVIKLDRKTLTKLTLKHKKLPKLPYESLMFYNH